MVAANREDARGPPRRAGKELTDDSKLLPATDEPPERFGRTANLLHEERGRGTHARARLRERVEDEQVSYLAHRRCGDGAHAFADAGEIPRGSCERDQPLVFGRFAFTRHMKAPDMKASTR